MAQSFPVNVRDYTGAALILPSGFPGQNDDIRARRRLLKNSNRSGAVKTIVVATATNSYTYTFYINGVLVTYTADGSATKIEIAAGIAAYINGNNFSLNNYVSAVSDGIDTVTITSSLTGEDFDLSLVDSKLTAAVVTAAGNASALNFGLIVCRNSTGEGAVVPSAVAAVAQVMHATPVQENSVNYELGVQLNDGTVYLATYTADGSATVQEIVEALTAQLNAMLPASTVVVTEDNVKCILTAEVAGTPFDVIVGSGGSTGVWTIATSVANVTANVSLLPVGVVEYQFGKPEANIPIDESFNVVTESERIWLKPEDAPSSITSTVYLRHTVNASDSTKKPGRIQFTQESGKAVALDAGTIELLSTTADNSGRYPFRIDHLRVA